MCANHFIENYILSFYKLVEPMSGCEQHHQLLAAFDMYLTKLRRVDLLLELFGATHEEA